jgi:ABC-type nitrate/sulfonate/bicarbonate transport system permease component
MGYLLLGTASNDGFWTGVMVGIPLGVLLALLGLAARFVYRLWNVLAKH